MQLVHQQPLTIDESERLTKEINKSEANKNKLLQTKNEKDEKRYKLIQALDDLINEVHYYFN